MSRAGNSALIMIIGRLPDDNSFTSLIFWLRIEKDDHVDKCSQGIISIFYFYDWVYKRYQSV